MTERPGEGLQNLLRQFNSARRLKCSLINNTSPGGGTVYATDLKSVGLTTLWVRIPPRVQNTNTTHLGGICILRPGATQLLVLRVEFEARSDVFVCQRQGKNRERRASRNFRQEIYL